MPTLPGAEPRLFAPTQLLRQELHVLRQESGTQGGTPGCHAAAEPLNPRKNDEQWKVMEIEATKRCDL